MDILYADSSLLVVNKPSGLATIPGSWEKSSSSLVELIGSSYGHIWVVHRLDKVTSGLVVFARSAQVHRLLNMQFDHHEIHKTYHAIVVGVPAWDEHIARHPLSTNVGHRHRTVVDPSIGKPSETAFHIIERFNGYALLSANPTTGRTHQIRVHAYALGFPLLGDTLYGAPQTALIPRPALHAHSLDFTFDGKPLSFIAPYPEDFNSALDKLRAEQE